jgi:hypothetical protein
MKSNITFWCIQLLLIPFSHAGWSVNYLHPENSKSSMAISVSGGQQFGAVFSGDDENSAHAAKWRGTAASFIDMNPDRASCSIISSDIENQQVGLVFLDGKFEACLWTGSAKSSIILHPQNAIGSLAITNDKDKQAGSVTFEMGKMHACIWSGSPESCLDIHPGKFVTSSISSISGNQQVGWVMFVGSNPDEVLKRTLKEMLKNKGELPKKDPLDSLSPKFHAGLWAGSAESFIDLHPATATMSWATSTDGKKQVGYARFGDKNHACLWFGTAASYLDLQPGRATESMINHTNGTFHVGAASFDGKSQACLWTGTSPEIENLHVFLDKKYKESSATHVYTSDKTNTVVGWALNGQTNQKEAVMWVCTP